MKALLLTLLYNAIRAYLGSGVFARVDELVQTMSTRDIPGNEKRQAVLDALSGEAKVVGNVALSAALEIIVLKQRS